MPQVVEQREAAQAEAGKLSSRVQQSSDNKCAFTDQLCPHDQDA